MAKANNFSRKIVFIKGVSSEVDLPERVDVIVSELIGYFALEEDLLKYLVDAKRRFLKEGGRIIPSHLEMFISPVETPDIYKKEIEFWNKNLYGIEFKKGRQEAINSRFVQLIRPEGLLAKPARLHSIDFYRLNELEKIYVHNSVTFKIEKKGILHGLCGWFSARLSEEILLSNSPQNRPTHWKNNFFPIERPVAVNKGDIVYVRMNAQSFSGNLVWSWIVEIEKSVKKEKVKKIKFNHTTFKNLPLAKDWILRQRVKKGFIPILKKEDKVRLFILRGCNGTNSTEEIARDLIKKFPASFGSIDEALDRVLEVTKRCEIRAQIKNTDKDKAQKELRQR